MLASAKQLYKTLQPYLNQDYILCPDTNFLASAPGLFLELKEEAVSISRQVFNELDHLKNEPPNATPEEMAHSYIAKEGFRVLDEIRANIMAPAPASVLERYELSDRSDGQIIADYIHYRDTEKKKVLFLTLDGGARIIANSANLECIHFDIEKFGKQREKELEKELKTELRAAMKQQQRSLPRGQRGPNAVQRYFYRYC